MCVTFEKLIFKTAYEVIRHISQSFIFFVRAQNLKNWFVRNSYKVTKSKQLIWPRFFQKKTRSVFRDLKNVLLSKNWCKIFSSTVNTIRYAEYEESDAWFRLILLQQPVVVVFLTLAFRVKSSHVKNLSISLTFLSLFFTSFKKIGGSSPFMYNFHFSHLYLQVLETFMASTQKSCFHSHLSNFESHSRKNFETSLKVVVSVLNGVLPVTSVLS